MGWNNQLDGDFEGFHLRKKCMKFGLTPVLGNFYGRSDEYFTPFGWVKRGDESLATYISGWNKQILFGSHDGSMGRLYVYIYISMTYTPVN